MPFTECMHFPLDNNAACRLLLLLLFDDVTAPVSLLGHKDQYI